MKTKAAPASGESQPADTLALRRTLDKNLWLVRIRWIYPLFIMAFFLAGRFLTKAAPINLQQALLIFLLPVTANFLFRSIIRGIAKTTEPAAGCDGPARLVSRQLAFDLATFALIVLFSGGLDSPLVSMMILYIMISTFLVTYASAFRLVLTAMVLLLAVAMLKGGREFFMGPRVASLLAYCSMFAFTYFVSAYLSRNLHRDEDLLRELLQQTRELSVTDGLTGLYNQMHFFELLERETRQSQRHGLNYSLVIFDVDHFKSYNDRQGHMLGSEALKRIAAVMKNKFRSTDLLAKYGGDEFVVILPQTDQVGAYLAAERLREGVEREPFPGAETQPQKRITISIGLACYPEHGSSNDEILSHADKALYFAKESGRNRTAIYNENIEKEIEEMG